MGAVIVLAAILVAAGVIAGVVRRKQVSGAPARTVIDTTASDSGGSARQFSHSGAESIPDDMDAAALIARFNAWKGKPLSLIHI